jgi:hypothetical protein
MMLRPLDFSAACGVIVIQYLDAYPLGEAIADILNKMPFGFGVRLLRLPSFRVVGVQESRIRYVNFLGCS